MIYREWYVMRNGSVFAAVKIGELEAKRQEGFEVYDGPLNTRKAHNAAAHLNAQVRRINSLQVAAGKNGSY